VVQDKDGILVERHKVADSRVYEVRATTITHLRPEAIFETLWITAPTPSSSPTSRASS